MRQPPGSCASRRLLHLDALRYAGKEINRVRPEDDVAAQWPWQLCELCVGALWERMATRRDQGELESRGRLFIVLSEAHLYHCFS